MKYSKYFGFVLDLVGLVDFVDFGGIGSERLVLVPELGQVAVLVLVRVVLFEIGFGLEVVMNLVQQRE